LATTEHPQLTPPEAGKADLGANAKTPALALRANRRLNTVLVQGLLLAGLLLFFRMAKVRALKLDIGLLGYLTLWLPELGAVAVLAALLTLLSTPKRRAWGIAWWPLFVVVQAAAYLAAVVEHTFFLHTGSRLNLDLASYASQHLPMLAGLIATGVDESFIFRLWLGGGCLAVGLAVGLLLPWRPRWQTWLRRLAVVALVGLLTPATPAVRQADLATSTFGELLQRRNQGTAAVARALPLVVPPDEIYQPPQIVAPAAGGPQAGPQTSQGPAPGLAPNIALILLESTRADVVTPYAPEEWRGLTPNLGKLAAEGWVFDQAYTSVSHTSKALVNILCGVFPRLEIPIYETLEGNLPLPCLPKLLETGGYRSAFLQAALGTFENRPGLVRNFGFSTAAFFETIRRPGFESVGYLGVDDFALLDPALSWMSRGGPEPFFLTLLSLGPHDPYQVPGQPMPKRGDDLLPHYLEAIRHQDRFLGELVAGMEQAGLLDNTVLIILGDHGEAFGEHQRMQHDTVPYEEVTHVPLVLWAPPRLGEPRRVGGLRHQSDLLPTILELAGLEWQGRLPGKSLLSSDGHDAVMSSCWYTDYCISLREGDRKVIYHFGLRPTEVFDLALDPDERRNLAESLAPEELEALENRLLAAKLGVDRFWSERPLLSGPRLWWQPTP
jgi:hypothetical protein